jgi:Abortive infection C-terminus
MAYTLQLLRSLIDAHPDRAERLRVHVEALELAIVGEPERCLERVRALFEATFHSIAPHLGLPLVTGEDFPSQNRRVIQALDFALDGHPDSERIATAIRKLIGSVNGTIGALAELSNIPGMRHGGSLDWSTLQRHHAVMLGGLCDTLIAFLFDVAWSRAGESTEPAVDRYEDHPAWNEALDEEWGSLRIGEGEYWASSVLFALDPTQYEVMRGEWGAEAA